MKYKIEGRSHIELFKPHHFTINRTFAINFYSNIQASFLDAGLRRHDVIYNLKAP